MMKTLVVGAAGKIGRVLCARCAEEKLNVVAMARAPEQLIQLGALGLQTVQADLLGELEHAFDGVEQVVFTAGSGGHTGPDMTLMVDLHGAVRCIDLVVAAEVKHFVMVSAARVDRVLTGPPKLRPYFAAKAAADRILRESGLHYTILRPGRLTDQEPTGRIRRNLEVAPEELVITRADVAECVLAVLDDPVRESRTIDLLNGDEPISSLRS